jgi:hypothetical protein
LSGEFQLHIDFRTGKFTAIIGPDVNDGIRVPCHALNLGRKSGIAAAIGGAPPRGAVSNDFWTERFVQNLGDRDIPLIDLETLGFHREEGFLGNRDFKSLPSGAEASPIDPGRNRVGEVRADSGIVP